MDGSAVTKAPAVPREWKWVGLEFESPKDNNTACEKKYGLRRFCQLPLFWRYILVT
jgi:hypothetical protein